MGRQLTLEEVIKDCEDEANAKANKVTERSKEERDNPKVLPSEY